MNETNGEIRIEKIQRNEHLVLSPYPSLVILPGDRLFLKDTSENLKHFEETLGATLYSLSDPDHPVDEETPLNDEGEQMAEVVVTRGSPLHYQSLEGLIWKCIWIDGFSNSSSEISKFRNYRRFKYRHVACR